MIVMSGEPYHREEYRHALSGMPLHSEGEAQLPLPFTKPATGTDDVAQQPHYTAQDIEPIEYMRGSMSAREFQAYCRGNVIKYVSRYAMKDGLRDLRKAKVYINWMIDSFNEELST